MGTSIRSCLQFYEVCLTSATEVVSNVRVTVDKITLMGGSFGHARDLSFAQQSTEILLSFIRFHAP